MASGADSRWASSPDSAVPADGLVQQLGAALTGRYTIEGELGRGGMGIVFLATDLRHRRKVAIKVLRPEIAGMVGGERFLREIRIAAGLTHPHVLGLHDSGECDSLLFYVMPYLDGETLRERLERERQLPIEDALRITLEVADGLEYAHGHGVVHRDIKPENILLCGGHAVIADFGVGRVISAAGSQSITASGLIIGTPAYMSPEQACSDQVDARTDVYALACVAYEMLAGEPPYTGPTAATIIARHMSAPIPSIRVVRSTVPLAMEEAIQHALAKVPADRPESAASFATALRAPGGAGAGTGRHGRSGILVLPFANLSPGTDTDYLSDGLSDGILTDLSRIDRLRVISRTSAMQLKGTTKDARSIGREVGVRYILEGTLRRSGTQLRITAKLVDADVDELIWASKFTGTMDDVLALEEEMSRTVIRALELTLTPADERKLAERPIPDARAYEYYLRARQETLRFTEDALERALKYLQQGVDILGENIVLRYSMGYVYWQYVNAGISSDPIYLAKARECAERILAIDPDSAHGHRLLGLISIHAGSALDVARHLKRAMADDPNDPDALLWLTLVYGFAGRASAAIPLVQRLLQIEPLTSFYQMLPGFLALMEGDFAEACAPFQKALRLEPGNPILRQTYGQILLMNGRRDEAIAMFENLLNDSPGTFFAQLGRLYLHGIRGEREPGQVLAEELSPAARSDAQYCWSMAQCMALLGNTEESVEWLETAAARSFWNYPLIARLDPLLTPVRTSRRFDALVATVERQWRSMEA